MSDVVPPSSSDPFRRALAEALASTYAIERELAGGGMSRVFVATERALDRSVVVKVLPPELAAGVNRERFQREIQLAARLQHPHIVPLLSAGEAAGSLYYTMPFIEGESLRDALERGAAFSVREVTRLFHHVLEALVYAHERGVIHRDIKPGNILLLRGGSGLASALLTDFGVAKALSAALPTSSGLTSVGVAIGTPAYMAPEQLAADPHADHRLDIYAAGLVAYELLSGAAPFQGASPQETMAAQLTRVPEPLHLVRPEVPRALSDLVMRCLAKDRDARPASAEAILLALDEATEQGNAPRPSSVATPAQHPARARARWAPVVGAALGLVMVVGGAWYWEDRADGRDGVSSRAAEVRPSVGAPAPAPAGVAASAAASAAAAATASPAPAVPAAPAALTRADSLAIARAVERAIAQERTARAKEAEPAPSARQIDSMRHDTWRQVADSIRREAERKITAAASAAAGRVTGPVLQGGRVIVRETPMSPMAPNAPHGTPFTGTAARPEPPLLAARDSAVRALAERTPPPAPGVRRVALLTMRDVALKGELAGTGSRATAALRASLARVARVEIADVAPLEGTRLRTRDVATATRSGAVVSGLAFVKVDHVVLHAQIFDARRGHPLVVEEAIPIAALDAAAVERWTQRVVRVLEGGVAW